MGEVSDINVTEKGHAKEEVRPEVAIQQVEDNNLDYDAQRLHDLGYKQEFKRSIGFFVQFGFAFTTMAVTAEYAIGVGPALNAGGPVAMFYGWIVVAFFVTFIGLGMAEIVSALPTAGGIYFWCYKLADEKNGRFMAWMAGYVYLIGLITAGMTLAWGGAQFLIGIIGARTGNFEQSEGVYVGIYCAILVICTIVNYFGTKVTSVLNKFMIFWSLIGTILIIVIMPAMAPTHQSAKWVFTEWINNTGYSSSGTVFLVGLLQAGWTLIGYETSVQIVEETQRADVAAPRGILLSIAGSWIQGTFLIISILFSIQNIDDLVSCPVPIAELFRSTTNEAVATFLMVILFVMQIASLCNSMLANAHLMWSMARDGCIPFSKFFYKLTGDNHTPFRCILFQTFCGIVAIMPSFGSEIFWQAIMSAAVIAINVAYGLPFFCRIVWTRNVPFKGPFSLGRASIPVNIIALIWIAFFAIILCFPSLAPVNAASMNYASLMIGAVVLFALGFWFVNGRYHYKGPLQNVHE